jgi:hypothetical protein
VLEASSLTKQPSVQPQNGVPDVLHLTHSCDSPGKLKEPGLQKNLGLPLSSAVGAASDMMLPFISHSGFRAPN